MQRIKAGIIGMGYIGVSHIEALRRIGFIDLVAVADSNAALARAKADEYYIPKCYDNIGDLLADPEIQVVHNCTPNFLHTEINRKIIESGKHIFSEKPLAVSSAESAGLIELLKDYPDTIAGVNFNYRMNPLVQEIRHKVGSGELGNIWLVHGSYLQDWLMYETDYNWRIEPEVNGPSRCIADIGSHWMDIVQHVIGAKITRVCADLVTTIPVRKKSMTQVETFSHNADAVYEDKEIKTEDYGAVLFKMSNGVSGVFCASEVSAGHGCFFNFEVNGSKASASWNQERADEMWMGFREQPNLNMMRNPNTLSHHAKSTSYLAKGHPEGWNDAFKGNIQRFYTRVTAGGKRESVAVDFSTFEEAHYIIVLTEAILKSARTSQWVDV
jgi:predicted dehydrogenase